MGATGALAALSAGNAYSQSQAISSQADYRTRIAALNSRNSELRAKDAIERGEEAAGRHKTQVRKLIGAQRAALAAQGIDVNSGSAMEVQNDTAKLGELDAMTIRNNAWREAMGYRMQGNNYIAEGEFAGLSAENQSTNTLLTGGIQALSYYNQSKKKK